MAIPDYQSLMLPVLQAGAYGEVKTAEVVAKLAESLGLSEAEINEVLPSGQQKTFSNRVNWAKTYLAKAGLVAVTKKGHYQATIKGQQVLAAPPPKINIKFLEQYPEFVAFKNSSPAKSAPSVEKQQLAPDEVIRTTHKELEEALASELLANVLSQDAPFFERLVVQLLVKMNYGGLENAVTLGKSGDGGVDGVIHADSLGLERVFVQAKRYTDSKVSPAQIRDFFGALDHFKASKGVFFTTSEFTESARQTAEKLSKPIALVDGEALARLMIKHRLGCATTEVFELKRVDEDFFE